MSPNAAELARIEQDNQKRMASYDQMAVEIAELSASATSSDRSVTVVAGPGGSIKEIKLADEAMRGSAQTLGRTITMTLQKAAANAARAQAEIVQRYAGDRMDLAGRVNKLQEEILAAEPKEDDGFQRGHDPHADQGSAFGSFTPAEQAPPPPSRPAAPPAAAPRPPVRRPDPMDDDDQGGFQMDGGSW